MVHCKRLKVQGFVPLVGGYGKKLKRVAWGGRFQRPNGPLFCGSSHGKCAPEIVWAAPDVAGFPRQPRKDWTTGLLARVDKISSRGVQPSRLGIAPGDPPRPFWVRHAGHRKEKRRGGYSATHFLLSTFTMSGMWTCLRQLHTPNGQVPHASMPEQFLKQPLGYD